MCLVCGFIAVQSHASGELIETLQRVLAIQRASQLSLPHMHSFSPEKSLGFFSPFLLLWLVQTPCDLAEGDVSILPLFFVVLCTYKSPHACARGVQLLLIPPHTHTEQGMQSLRIKPSILYLLNKLNLIESHTEERGFLNTRPPLQSCSPHVVK